MLATEERGHIMFEKAFAAVASWFRPREGPGYPVLSFEGNGCIKVDPADIFKSRDFQEQLRAIRTLKEDLNDGENE